MNFDADRLTAALSAVAGGVFWGFHYLATTLWAGGSIHTADLWRAAFNVIVGIISGVLVAYVFAPALLTLIPTQAGAFRDIQVIGFGIGAGAWELAPFLYRLARKKIEARLDPDQRP